MPSFSPAAEPATAERIRLLPALGTFVRLAVRGDTRVLDAALAEAAAAIARIDASMSFHRTGSALHDLHRAQVGVDLAVDAELWSVLSLAHDLWRGSRGIFDPTVAAALVANGALPVPAGVPRPARGADFGDVELPGPNRVRLRRRVWLDLGGIAKGYAVDRALERLRIRGVTQASVNAGGDLACFGAREQVGLRDPREPSRLCYRISVDDAAIATSGDYFRPGALRGAKGVPTRRRHGSVTVIAPTCAVADGLTKIVWAAPRRAAAMLDAHQASALILDGRVRPRWLNG